MTIDSDVLFLGLAKAIKVKYRAIEGNFGHGAFPTCTLLTHTHLPLQIKLSGAGAEIDKSKFLDSLSCADKWD
ncbi:hypothetical protein H9P43_005237 [Blastocladiella emersonii ATCC 22665]|nr:hypothetical protein H9P43_005237 [Blastocladiella emersonii ATCC 22665]